MYRRNRNTSFNYGKKEEKGGEGRCLMIAIGIVVSISMTNTILTLGLVIAICYLIYHYLNRQNKRLENYHSNWSKFYNSEFKYKLQNDIALCFTLIGLVLIRVRPITGLMFIFASTIIYGVIDKLIKQRFHKTYYSKSKGLLLGVLGFIGLVSNLNYQKIEDIKIAEEKAIEIKYEKESQEKENISNNFYSKAKENIKIKNYKKALSLIDSSLDIVPYNVHAMYSKALIFKETGKYEKALEILQDISPIGGISSEEFYFNRGICLIKLGETKAAVHELKLSLELGNKEAEKIYNKINPVKRRVISYQTMCCDGTPSPTNAKGRGACSHHGGVCDWNKPIYEEYREIVE